MVRIKGVAAAALVTHAAKSLAAAVPVAEKEVSANPRGEVLKLPGPLNPYADREDYEELVKVVMAHQAEQAQVEDDDEEDEEEEEPSGINENGSKQDSEAGNTAKPKPEQLENPAKPSKSLPQSGRPHIKPLKPPAVDAVRLGGVAIDPEEIVKQNNKADEAEVEVDGWKEPPIKLHRPGSKEEFFDVGRPSKPINPHPGVARPDAPPYFQSNNPDKPEPTLPVAVVETKPKTRPVDAEWPPEMPKQHKPCDPWDENGECYIGGYLREPSGEKAFPLDPVVEWLSEKPSTPADPAVDRAREMLRDVFNYMELFDDTVPNPPAPGMPALPMKDAWPKLKPGTVRKNAFWSQRTPYGYTDDWELFMKHVSTHAKDNDEKLPRSSGRNETSSTAPSAQSDERVTVKHEKTSATGVKRRGIFNGFQFGGLGGSRQPQGQPDSQYGGSWPAQPEEPSNPMDMANPSDLPQEPGLDGGKEKNKKSEEKDGDLDEKKANGQKPGDKTSGHVKTVTVTKTEDSPKTEATSDSVEVVTVTKTRNSADAEETTSSGTSEATVKDTTSTKNKKKEKNDAKEDGKKSEVAVRPPTHPPGKTQQEWEDLYRREHFQRPLSRKEYEERNWNWLRCVHRHLNRKNFLQMDVGGMWATHDTELFELMEHYTIHDSTCFFDAFVHEYWNGERWGDGTMTVEFTETLPTIIDGWRGKNCNFERIVKRAALKIMEKYNKGPMRRTLHIFNCNAKDSEPDDYRFVLKPFEAVYKDPGYTDAYRYGAPQ